MQGLTYGSAAAASNQLQLQLSAGNGDTHTVTISLYVLKVPLNAKQTLRIVTPRMKDIVVILQCNQCNSPITAVIYVLSKLTVVSGLHLLCSGYLTQNSSTPYI